MSNLILLFLSLFIGLGLQRLKDLPANAHIVLNTIVLYVPLPAMVLLSVPGLKWELELVSLALVPWLNILLAFFLFRFIGKLKNWDQALVGCLIITVGHGNTSFVGFPVIEALYGADALKYAVVLDQLGSFLIVSTIGVSLAAMYAQGKIGKRKLARKLLAFPPFIAFVLALVLGAVGWHAEGYFKGVLEKLAGLLTPLALISVGLQLKWKEVRHEIKYLSLGLGFKLIIFPALIWMIYSLANLPSDIFRIAVIEAAMAPMITSSILAAAHGLHPGLAGMMVGVGVPISFLSLTFWYWVLY